MSTHLSEVLKYNLYDDVISIIENYLYCPCGSKMEARICGQYSSTIKITYYYIRFLHIVGSISDTFFASLRRYHELQPSCLKFICDSCNNNTTSNVDICENCALWLPLCALCLKRLHRYDNYDLLYGTCKSCRKTNTWIIFDYVHFNTADYIGDSYYTNLITQIYKNEKLKLQDLPLEVHP